VTTEGKEERGPRIGAPEQALDGFLRKHGATRDALKAQVQAVADKVDALISALQTAGIMSST
jgi:glycyl-tRNA synthetase beta chain